MTRRGCAVVAVILAASLPYLNCLKNDFVWDDRPLILENYRIKNPGYLGHLFSRDYFDHVDEEIKYGYYRPVISLSYMLDYGLWEDSPLGYHLTNIILHALNSVLILVLVRRFLPGRPGVALVSALIFAVHPVHTESVAWIAGRTDLVMVFFLLASLLSFDSYCTFFGCPGRRGRGRILLALSLALFLGALFAKETAIVFPVIVGAYLLLFRTGWSSGRRWRLFAVYLAVALAYLFVRFGLASIKAGPAGALTLSETVLSCCSTLLLYTGKMIFPLNLSAYITNPVAESPLDPRVLGGAAILLAIVVWVLWAWRKNRAMAFFLAFALISLFPLANVVRISSPDDMGFPAAERFLYMPSIALIVLAVVAAGSLLEKRRWAAVLAAAVVVVFAVLTAGRTAVWRDEETLFTDALSSSPEAPLLWNNVGVYYSRIGRHDDAVSCLHKAISLEGRIQRLLNNLATAERRRGNFDESIELLHEALTKGEPLSKTYFNLGMAYAGTAESERAIDWLRQAINLNPENIEALTELAEHYKRLGRYGPAETFYLKALEVHEASASNWSNLGVVYKLAGKLEAAEAAFRNSISLSGGVSAAHSNLGALLAELGRFEEALDELETARSLDPDNLDAANAMGGVLVLVGKEDEAEEILAGLIREYPRDKEAYINMGIMRHGQGRREEAVRFFKSALDIDPDDGRVISYVEQLADRSPGEKK